MADKITLVTIGAGIGAIGIILAFAKKIVGIPIGILHWIKSVLQWVREQSQAAKDISIIRKEVTVNGGGSLKDAVVRIETRISIGEQDRRASDSDALHAIFQSDDTGKCLWVNPAYCKMVDRQIDDITGSGWESYIHWEDRENILTEWKKAVASKREFEMQYRLTNGNPVIVKAHPLRHPIDGRLLGYRGSVRVVETKPT